jgi:hypothetical protein
MGLQIITTFGMTLVHIVPVYKSEKDTLSSGPVVPTTGIEGSFSPGVPGHFGQHRQTLDLRKKSGGWWFMYIIPVTQEAEIRRIMVGGQPSQQIYQA